MVQVRKEFINGRGKPAWSAVSAMFLTRVLRRQELAPPRPYFQALFSQGRCWNDSVLQAERSLGAVRPRLTSQKRNLPAITTVASPWIQISGAFSSCRTRTSATAVRATGIDLNRTLPSTVLPVLSRKHAATLPALLVRSFNSSHLQVGKG